VILLSFFYSNERTGYATELVHLSAFALLALVVFVSVSQGARIQRLSAALERLRESSAQIQTRADLALVAVVVGITSELGLETILAAFTVGVIRGMTEERDDRSEQKREAVALGIFVPFFFVSSGLDFQLDELFATIGGVIRLPVFVLALLAVHVIPAMLYRRTMGTRRAIAAGLLQATSFSFIIVATQIGLQLHIMVQATGTALVGAGLISVIAFPAIAFSLLGGEARGRQLSLGDDDFASAATGS
jgi:Kef-type K+ transport system membrane component KefB